MDPREKSSFEPLLPAQPIPEGAEVFSARLHELLDGTQKDEESVNRSFAGLDDMFDRIAAGLYSMASMLVGEGEQSIQLIETAVTTARFVEGESALEARQSSRRALAEGAIRLLANHDPGCLNAPRDLHAGGGCIGDDELDAVGVSHDELERMLSGADHKRMRNWIKSLSTDMRVVFVLRAVALLSAAEIAELLRANAGPGAAGWTASQVREISRQSLCSLASQHLHATLS
jgi:hypothetical protein